MPVILGDEASTDIWLNGSPDTKFSSVLKPYEKEDLVCFSEIMYRFKFSLLELIN